MLVIVLLNAKKAGTPKEHRPSAHRGGNLRIDSRRKKRGTVTSFPVDSRTTVLGETQAGLTSGFGMGPGKHYRCDRAPIFLRIGSMSTTINVAMKYELA